MPEIPVSSLDARHQVLAEKARVALEQGNLDYAVGACAEVLKAAPGCLTVRRWQRVALRRRETGKTFAACALRGLPAPWLRWGRSPPDPARLLAAADAQLVADPTSVRALKQLASAAAELDLPETVVFAREAIRELQPADRGNLLSLGEAWLVAGQPARAVEVANALLALRPGDAAGQELLRKATVAQTIAAGQWETTASFRERLDREASSNASPSVPPPPAKIVALDARTPAEIHAAWERAGGSASAPASVSPSRPQDPTGER
jgi:hypothetical protein